INHGSVELGPNTTVIHDEAALASTREQLRLLRAVETSGARLIAVGDPQQNQPVGAGGLWDQIENTARDAGAHVELTVNQRARDPADRHAQTLFRKGEIELAIRTYAARDRVHIDHHQQRVEDQALEAAHQDRTEGKSTIVIAQTSNEHLDELNARAQAIRKQHKQLGDQQLPIPGRPYSLHAGDEVQIRHTINHPDHGPLRNGIGAAITRVDPRSGELSLRLADGSEVVLDEEQIADADLRLAYVQHPFPAQGHTTDTAHVIIHGQATREGTYVAVTRARQQTHLYAAEPDGVTPDTDRLEQLAERVSHSEPEIPSIMTPLAHESVITDRAERASIDQPVAAPSRERDGEQLELETARAIADEGAVGIEAAGERRWPGRATSKELAVEHGSLRQVADHDHGKPAPVEDEAQQPSVRTWPARTIADDSPEGGADRLERESPGWEM
ncbi:MAG: AAA family ATPase, partial [Solirubrobacteraceae bacterium]